MNALEQVAMNSTPEHLPASISHDAADTLDLILNSLDDSKAQEIVTIPLEGKSSIGDYMIIASGTSHRHVGSIADRLLSDLKDSGRGKAKVEGLPNCDWVLVDTGEIIVHLFRPEVRGFYNLEKMWNADFTDPSAVA